MNWLVKSAAKTAFPEIDEKTIYIAIPHGITYVNDNGKIMQMEKWALRTKHWKYGRTIRLAWNKESNKLYFGTISRFVNGIFTGTFSATPGQDYPPK